MIYYTNISCVVEWANMTMGASGMISVLCKFKKLWCCSSELSRNSRPISKVCYVPHYNVLLFVDCWVSDVIYRPEWSHFLFIQNRLWLGHLEDQLLPLPNLFISIGRYWKMYMWGAKDIIVHLFPFLHDRSYCQCVLVLISRKNK